MELHAKHAKTQTFFTIFKNLAIKQILYARTDKNVEIISVKDVNVQRIVNACMIGNLASLGYVLILVSI
jgi:hypothetical protein